MVRKANPWLRVLVRAGKQQQRTAARTLETLLAPPKPRRTPKTSAKKPAAPAALALPTVFHPLHRPPEPATVKRLALPSPGPAAGKWLAFHVNAGGRRLAYWLFLPDVAPGRDGWPLVMMLHGCEQSATQFAQGTRMNRHASRAGVAVLYPQQAASAHAQRCWTWFERATQQGGGEVPLLLGALFKVLDGYPIDRSRIYVAGLSAGAAMANILALSHPELFAGLGLHSAPLYGAGHGSAAAWGIMQHGGAAYAAGAIAEVLQKNAAFPPMPTILVQGEDDPVVRAVNLEQLERQAMLLNRLPVRSRSETLKKAGGRDTHPHMIRDVYRDEALLLRVVRVAELKHAWSGGDGQVPYCCGSGPDASRMMLEFFLQHRRVIGY